MKAFHVCAEYIDSSRRFLWNCVIHTNTDVFAPDFLMRLKIEVIKGVDSAEDPKKVIIHSLTLIGERQIKTKKRLK